MIKAIRNERKKEIVPMEEFKKSLIFTNKSITKVEIVKEPESQQK